MCVDAKITFSIYVLTNKQTNTLLYQNWNKIRRYVFMWGASKEKTREKREWNSILLVKRKKTFLFFYLDWDGFVSFVLLRFKKMNHFKDRLKWFQFNSYFCRQVLCRNCNKREIASPFKQKVAAPINSFILINAK